MSVQRKTIQQKKEKLLRYVTTGMDLKILSTVKKARHKRITTEWFPLYVIQKRQSYRDKNQMCGCQGLGVGGKGFMTTRDKEILEGDGLW